jgi:hypothetical protein
MKSRTTGAIFALQIVFHKIILLLLCLTIVFETLTGGIMRLGAGRGTESWRVLDVTEQILKRNRSEFLVSERRIKC